MVPQLYPKMYEKWRKLGLWRNGIIQKPIKIFDSKFDKTTSKPINTLSYNEKFASFKLTEN